MNRILVFDGADTYKFDIDPNRLLSAVVTEEINGVHSLDISTTQELRQSDRLLTANDMGVWEEYVVINDSSQHDNGSRNAYGTFHAIWSLQYDLSTVYGEDVESGGEHDVTAAVALGNALNGTRRWTVGTVTVAGEATIEMFGNSAYERIQSVVKAYGGEVQPEITVGTNTVTGRAVSLLGSVGKDIPTRRFEWSRDVTGIKRKAQEVALCCRIIPVGKSDDVTIEDVNNGVRWIEDSEAASAYRVPDGRGGWEYPTRKVKFSDIEDDRELLAYATEHIQEYTRPVPTYEASVLQYAAAGMSYKGVALGDVVQIVDRGFNPDVPLRLEGRAKKIVRSLTNDRDVTLTVGDVSDGLANSFQRIDSMLSAVSNTFGNSLGSTALYLKWLTGQMNEYINSLGGWTYIVPGMGIVTYSCEVSDPTVGAEAKALVAQGTGSVTEIRGGAVRIADSLTSSGDWDFRTVLLPGQIAAEMVTAAHLVTGWIGSADAAGNYSGYGNYINLDTGETHLGTQLSSRNLIKNGSFSLGTNNWTGSGVVFEDEEDPVYGHHLKVVQSSQGSTSSCIHPSATTNFTHSNNVTYTLVFWAKADSANQLYASRAGIATDMYVNGSAVDTGWRQYIATMTSTGTGSLSFWLGSPGTLYLADVMLVRGNSSFGFSENPDDNGQEGILYRLTGGYVNEGLYIDNGHLYMNASYIHGGTLVAGGANNVNGVIRVLDANGNIITKFDKDGAYIEGDIEMLSKHSPYQTRANIGSFVGSFDGGSSSDSSTKYGMRIGLENISSSTPVEQSALYLLPDKYNAYIGSTNGLVLQASASSGTTANRSSLSLGTGSATMTSYNYKSRSGNSGYMLSLGSTEASLSFWGGSSGGSVFNVQRDSRVSVYSDLDVTGNKNRLVDTADYGSRTLSAYETPTPSFGDVGGGVISEDGTCVVPIDPILSEAARTDLVYRVFLQPLGRGEAWVSEKRRDGFIVCGTPNLAFDWEIKAVQAGYEGKRFADRGAEDALSVTADEIAAGVAACFRSAEDYTNAVRTKLEEAIA